MLLDGLILSKTILFFNQGEKVCYEFIPKINRPNFYWYCDKFGWHCSFRRRCWKLRNSTDCRIYHRRDYSRWHRHCLRIQWWQRKCCNFFLSSWFVFVCKQSCCLYCRRRSPEDTEDLLANNADISSQLLSELRA